MRERSSSLLLRLIALVLCTGLCLDASAESSVESAKRYTKRLKLISKQLAVQSKRLSALDKRRRALNEELLRQEYALIDLELGRRQMARDREAINWEEERIARRIAQTELEIARTNVLIRERTRAYFIQNRLSPIERLLSDLGSNDAVLTAFFLKRVTTYDRSLLLRARELHRAHEWERETLAHLRIVQSVLHRTIQERSFEVAKAAESQRALLRRADAHAARVEAELSALKEEATRVEKVVAALTSGSGAESPGEPNLKGLARGLQLPAKGVLVSGFGKHKVPGYNEYVFHKGLEYSTTPGSLVTSVARGVVRYAGPMPGYGKVLIIDHGRRDYSLYGRLGKIIVKIGQGVGVGEVVGVTGSPDRRNRNFYFEIRRGGTPRNPINYLINNGEDRARS